MKKSKIVILLFFIFSSISLAEKTDIVIMDNGTFVIGEIKKMEFGKLTFKTDDMGTMSIEWDNVRHLISKYIFEVNLQDGSVLLGSLDSSSVEGEIIIKIKNDRLNITTESIVGIAQIKSSFWDKNTGTISLGLSYVKATQTGQIILSATGAFRSEKWNTSSSLNSVFSFQDQKQTAKNQNLNITLERELPKKWLAGATLSFEQNTELGIQLRTSIIPQGGYIFIQSNTNVLWGVGGLSLNRENFTDTTESIFNLDGYAQLKYQIFMFDDPEISLNTYANVYPGLSDWGRIRSNLYISLDWEIINNFYWDLTFNFNYDNRPTGDASTNDYQLRSALKYKFN